ncbi:molybdopterin-binding protein, partial [bacterium]|nr:molybdopterin-binding protein [bacterium]
MKLIRTQDAVGQVLCHDITQIIPGRFKGPVFRKGHIVQPQDIPVLLSVGKEHLYVWENDETMLHENEAAEILRQLCQNENMEASEAKEGKIELTAACDGLFLVDTARLRALNAMGDLMIATRPGGFVVRKGDKLCGTRVIPLVIQKERMEQARALAGDTPLLRLVPLKQKKFGVVTTGSEVKNGLIEDKFTPILQRKLAEFGCEMLCHACPGDEADAITGEVLRMLDAGCEMVFCTGG